MPALDERIWNLLATGEDRGRGLSYLLHPGQLEMRALAQQLQQREVAGRVCSFRMSRRYGKSRWMVTDFMERGVSKKPKPWRMKYAAPTRDDAEEIVMEHAQEMADRAPAAIRPQWMGGKRRWEFADGSHCKVVGCKDRTNINRLRGRSMDRGYVDEPGSIDDVKYLMRSVLLPQLVTTGGIIVFSGSPSETPAHESTGFFVGCESAGRGFNRNIYQAPHVSTETILEFMMETCPELTREEAEAYASAETGPVEGIGADHWAREYLGRFVTDADRAVVPEFPRHKEHLVGEWERPPFFHAYSGMDLGYNDLTFCVFAYHDFENAKLVIEDEVVLRHTLSGKIAEKVEAKERELWTDRQRPMGHPNQLEDWEPIRRVADAPEQVLADLRARHGRGWLPPNKTDSDAALNALRMACAKHQLIIHPRCKQLIAHLEHAVWNRSRKSFDRSGDFGHFDGVDAMKYLLRAVHWNANPYPALWDATKKREDVWVPKSVLEGSGRGKLKQILGGRRRRAG